MDRSGKENLVLDEAANRGYRDAPMRRLFGPFSFYRQVLSIAVPVMVQQLVMSLVSLIDNFMVAGLGDEKMAAVNVANQISFVYLVIMMTLNAAGGIYLAQFVGSGDTAGQRQAFRFKMLLGSVVSAVYFTLCWAMPEALISVMTEGNAAQGPIVAEGALYLRIVSLTLLPITFSSAAGSAYRESGEPRVPMFVSAGAALVNTALNWVLIYGNLGAPRLEIAGAAIATVTARCVEAAVFYLRSRNGRAAFFVPLRELGRMDRRLMSEILGKSGMMIFSETTWVVSETVMTALYNGRGGAETVAGMAAGFTIANLFFLLFPGIHSAAAVVVGGSLGAGRLDEARQRAGWMLSGALVGGVAVGLLAAASTALIPLVFFNLSPSARQVTRGLVLVIAVYLPLWTLLNGQFAVARSGGDAALGMYVDVSVTFLIFLPLAFLLAKGTSIGPVALFGILKSTDFLKEAIAVWRLRKEVWVRNLTVRVEA